MLLGLIDAHVYTVGGELATLSQSEQFSVTPILEMGNSYEVIKVLREPARDPNMADYRTATVPPTIPGGYAEPVLKAGDPLSCICL